MPILTVKRIGNSLGVIFPKDLAQRKGIQEFDRVEVDPKPVRDIRQLRGILRKYGAPTATELNRMTNEGEEL